MGVIASRGQAGLPHDRTVCKSIGRRSSILGFDADMFACQLTASHSKTPRSGLVWWCNFSLSFV